jgi:hypothetical protein
MIPAAYTAFVTADGDQLPKWPCGDTEDEARAYVLKEFPNAVEIA